MKGRGEGVVLVREEGREYKGRGRRVWGKEGGQGKQGGSRGGQQNQAKIVGDKEMYEKGRRLKELGERRVWGELWPRERNKSTGREERNGEEGEEQEQWERGEG